MANVVGLLLFAIVVLYVIAMCMKDPKVFTRAIMLLVLGLVVGAGVKHIKKLMETPEKAVVAVEISNHPTQSNSTSVVWNAELAKQDSVSQEPILLESDNSIAETEGLPTVREKCGYIDDS
jgi:hypothetical protein